MTAPPFPHWRRQWPVGLTIVFLISLLSILMAVTVQNSSKLLENDSFLRRQLRHMHGIFSDQQAYQNALQMKQWRTNYQELCADESFTEEDLLRHLSKVTKPSILVDGTHEDTLPVEPCRQVFLDFGANVGDSLQKFISAGIPKCVDKLPKHHPSFNATTGGASTSFRGGNSLVSWSWNRMNDFSSLQLLPEDYCYYGIEGNPVFKTRLQQLERAIMRMDPRPVRRAHFFTETVSAGEDGPTVLYLDTVNTEQNAWGSSLLETHKDVQASARQANGRVEAHVQGMTLGTLLNQVLPTTRGSHVMMKMDIEGGEFAVLEQAASEGKVCDFIQSGIQMDMILEGHNTDITGVRTPEQEERFQQAKDHLVKCGLNLWFVKDAGR